MDPPWAFHHPLIKKKKDICTVGGGNGEGREGTLHLHAERVNF